ncbi:WD40 repeat domain-containing protein [Nocardia sp. GCM10030253]|uniref:WD40 repeat domain-containing protein n=1 Tax=Nocardia sp. GCM10030253 TaxID=3273404 RepID=UPI0036458EA0
MSDIRFRQQNAELVAVIPADALPEPGSIDAAILARNSDIDRFSAELYTLLGGSEPAPINVSSVRHLLTFLTAAATPRTIVVDGVDEAAHPARLVVEVIGPMARLRNADGRPLIRMLIGLRSSRSEMIASEPDSGPTLLALIGRMLIEQPLQVVRTDEAPTVTADIASYIDELLSATGRYSSADLHLERTRAAEIVAATVTPSFLDARLAGQRLRESPHRQRLDDQEWLGTLADGTVSLLRADLIDVARDIGEDVESLLPVMRATAFALGRGLPFADVWPAVAAGVAGRGLPRVGELIETILAGRLGGYFTTDEESGRMVYRPSHERLAETMRDNAQHLLPVALDFPESPFQAPSLLNRQIARALAASLDSSGQTPPHPYVQSYLIEHARRGDSLTAETIPLAFLPWNNGTVVRTALGLPLGDAGENGLTAWARVEPFLADQDVRARQATLQFALVAAEIELPRPLERMSLPLRSRWASWRLPKGNILARVPKPIVRDRYGAHIHLASVPLLDGRSLLAVARDGVVMLDPVTGATIGQLWAQSGRAVLALAAIPIGDGRILLAIGDKDGVWTWDPFTDNVSTEPVVPGRVWQLWTAYADDGRAVLGFVRYFAEEMHFWDPLSGDLMQARSPAARITEPRVSTSATSIALPDGRTVFAVSTADGVQLWDSVSRDVIGKPWPPHPEWAEALAALPMPDGRVLLAIASQDTVWLSDPTGGRAGVGLEEDARHRPGVTAFAVLSLPDRGVLLATGSFGRVGWWDPVTGISQGTATPRQGRSSAIAAVHLPDGQVLLATGDDDGVRLRDPLSGTPVGSPIRAVLGEISTIAILRMPDGTVFLAASSAGRIAVTNLATRRVADVDVPIGHRNGQALLAEVPLPDGSVLLAICVDEYVWLWDPAASTVVHNFTCEGDVRAITVVGRASGRVLIAVGTAESVWIWDALADTPIGQLQYRYGPVTAMVAIQRRDADPLLAVGSTDGTVGLWDTVLGTELSIVCLADRVDAMAATNDPATPALFVGGPAGFARIDVDLRAI